MNKNKKIKTQKNENNKIENSKKETGKERKSLLSFAKAAPYTLLMILVLAGFWGYKAVWAADGYLKNNTGTAQENTVGTNENPLEELGKIETSLTDPSLQEGAEGEEGSADISGSDISNPENADADEAENADGETSADEATDGMTGDEGDETIASEDDEAQEEALTRQISEEELSKYPYSLGEMDGDYIIYEPKEIDSRYYSDRGRVPLDTLAEYCYAEDDYFDDACFIGDSRMVGIYDYSGWDKADFFCDNGFCAYNYVGGKNVLYQNEGKKYSLDDAMSRKQYGKIYIMLGTNDCGYGNTDNFKENYIKMLDMIMEKQPDAIIYTIANLRVSAKAEKEDKTGVYNNIDINDKNAAIAEISEEKGTYFIDCNIPFVDEKGYLIEEYTFDGFHVYAEQYVEMAELFRAHALKI